MHAQQVAALRCCLPRFGVSGFPTLKWFPKDNKDGKDYEGGRDLSAFVDFINKEAGTARSDDGTLNCKVGAKGGAKSRTNC